MEEYLEFTAYNEITGEEIKDYEWPQYALIMTDLYTWEDSYHNPPVRIIGRIITNQYE
jgi:hypothetical protein